MWLTNIEIRVKKYNEGYAVEVKKKVPFLLIFTKYKWLPLICYNGSDDVFYYKTQDFAIYQAKCFFQLDLLSNIIE